jgi:Fur family zinc uptake transcriptional regulator
MRMGKKKKTDIQKIVEAVESYCAKEGIRFTEPRRHVLEIIAGADGPVGAYDVLEQLGKYIDNPKPPTAYRAIEFLQEHGFIHRIASLNAFVACATDHRHHGSQFLVCDSCGKVVEAHLCDLPDDLAARAEKEGFRLTRWDAELHGTCGDCCK